MDDDVNIEEVTKRQPGDFGSRQNAEVIEPEKAPFGEVFNTAFRSTTLTGEMAQAATADYRYNYDPEFEVTEDMLKESEGVGIPPQFLESLASAPSEEVYLGRQGAILRELEDREFLAEQGARGTAITFGAALVDPVAWMTGPVGRVAGGSRLANSARSAAVTGVSAGIYESALAGVSETYTAEDAAMGTAAAFLLGGAFGLTGRTRYAGMSDEATEGFNNLLRADVKEIQAWADEPIDDIPLPQLGSSAGAQEVNPLLRQEPINPKASERLDEAFEENPATSFAVKILGKETRFDIAGRMGRSENPLVRRLNWARDAAGKEDGAVSPETASEWKRRKVEGFSSTMEIGYQAAERKYAESLGKRRLSLKDQRQFNEEVSRAIRNPDEALTPFHAQAAKAAAGQFKKVLEEAKAAGVKGLDNVETDPKYFARIFNVDKVRRAEQRVGTANLKNLVAKAIVTEQGEQLTAKEAQAIAQGYVDTIRSLGIEKVYGQHLGESGREELIELVSKRVGKVEDGVVESIVDLLAPSKAKQGKVSHANRRLRLDDTVSLSVAGRRPGEVLKVSFDDLIETDTRAVLTRYTNTMLGQAAMARQGIKSKADFERLVRDVKQTAPEIPGYAGKKAENDLKLMEFLYNHITGKPNYAVTADNAKIIDRFLKWNFTRTMNRTGMAQAPEVVLMANDAGTKLVMDSVPALKQMIGAIKRGEKIEDDILDTLVDTMGLGTKTFRGNAGSRFADVAGDIEKVGEERLDDFLHNASQITAKFSGLGPITDTTQLVTARSLVIKMHDAALNGKTIMSPKRWAHLGIDETMMSRIQTELKKVETYTAASGKQRPRLDLGAWDDVGAKDAFINAVDRHTRRIIQDPDIGMLHEVMPHPLARIVFQLRGFSIASFTNHLQYGINMKDARAFGEFTSTLFGGLVGYAMSTYLAAIGVANSKEFLDERMSPKALAAATLYRSTHASFMPGLFDAGITFAGFDPVFGYARNSQLSTTTFLQNPTADALDNTLLGVGGSVRAALDPNYDFSQRDAQRLFRLLPFNNAVGIQNMLNLAKQPLPETS